MTKKIIIFLISIIFLFNNFIFLARAEGENVEIPETVEGAQGVVKDLISTAREQLPKNIKSLWDEEVLPIWSRMFDWFNDNIGSRIGEIIKKKEPGVKQEFEEEKGEMTQDIVKESPKFLENIKIFWQEIKNIF